MSEALGMIETRGLVPAIEAADAMTKAAEVINESIERTLQLGLRTTDIYDEKNKLVSTTEMTDAIIENFEEIYNEQAIGVFTL